MRPHKFNQNVMNDINYLTQKQLDKLLSSLKLVQIDQRYHKVVLSTIANQFDKVLSNKLIDVKQECCFMMIQCQIGKAIARLCLKSLQIFWLLANLLIIHVLSNQNLLIYGSYLKTQASSKVNFPQRRFFSPESSKFSSKIPNNKQINQMIRFAQIKNGYKEIIEFGQNVKRANLYLLIIIKMSNRQIELQVIIKNHENKIMLLKQEAKILAARYDQKVGMLQEDHNKILAQKNKVIQYLEMQNRKDRQLIYYEQEIFDNRKNRERQQLAKEVERYKSKCYELERRIQAITQKYQMKRKQVEQQNSRLREANQFSNTSRFSMQTQIEKLNKFYHSSRVVTPQRNQTVEWVDKLTAFMSRYQLQSSKTTKETMVLLKGAVQNLKTELAASLKHANQQEQTYVFQINGTFQKIKALIDEQNKVNSQLSEDNERFWQGIKKQKINQNSQKASDLEKQLVNCKKIHQQQSEQLTSKVKMLQSERKTLLLGFTQLKTLNEARQKTYREQIAALKQSIEQLLAGIQDREIEFQNQTQLLHSQLTAISQRYYENIQFPLQKMSGKLENQIKGARNQLQKLVQNKAFVKLLQNLQSTLQSYINQQSNSAKFSYELAEYNKKTSELARIGKQLIQIEVQRELFSQGQSKQAGLSQQKEMVIQSTLSDLQWKQREHKLNYQLNLLRRQNKQLKDAFGKEDGKYKDQRSTSAIKRQPNRKKTDDREANLKIIELQSQVEELKRVNQGYKEEFMYQLRIMKQAILKSIGRQPKDMSQYSEVHDGITSINYFNENIKSYLQQQKNHIRSVRDTLSALDKMLVKPVQIFDSFVNKISEYQNPFKLPIGNQKTISNQAYLNLQRLQAVFSDINVRRQDNVTSVSKLILQLIKVVRQSQPISVKHKVNQVDLKNEKRQENAKNNKISKQKSLQKRFKQIQALRIKNREEMVRKIQKIQENIRAVDQKNSKKAIPSSARIQQLIDKRLTQLTEKITIKCDDSASELGQITSSALKDLKTKLKACLNDNQGLIKQLQCLQSYRKS